MAEVIPVGFYGAEGDAAETVEFEDLCAAGRGGGDVDVAFFAYAYLVSETEDRVAATVGVEREVVEAAVGEAVTVIYTTIKQSVNIYSIRVYSCV